MCDDLAAYRVPPTLVHGDLHPGNIAVPNGGCVFFDWTDGCVAHPFFDLSQMLLETRLLPAASAASARLLDAYLDMWTDDEPRDRLQQAWALARPLAALHQAVSFQHIVAALETASKPELAWGIAFWLRQLLQIMSL
jgi:aminoglycoside phosphotransferase (APT) family kinase protein